MNVSVIATVKNEGEALRPLLDSLIQQSQPPDEVIFCDGGSTDDTLEVLTEYKTWLPLKIKRDEQEMLIIAKFPALQH